jgi:hypothetical protein
MLDGLSSPSHEAAFVAQEPVDDKNMLQTDENYLPSMHDVRRRGTRAGLYLAYAGHRMLLGYQQQAGLARWS